MDVVMFFEEEVTDKPLLHKLFFCFFVGVAGVCVWALINSFIRVNT